MENKLLFPLIERPEPAVFATSDFPRLLMNASVEPFSYLDFVVDYINAPWKLLDWKVTEDSYR